MHYHQFFLADVFWTSATDFADKEWPLSSKQFLAEISVIASCNWNSSAIFPLYVTQALHSSAFFLFNRISHHITLFILGGTNVKMSGPCFTANDNIVVQLDNDVNINATFSEELTSSVTILVLNKTWRLSFRYLVIKVYTSGIHIRYFINYSLSNCLLSSLLSSVKSVNLRKN